MAASLPYAELFEKECGLGSFLALYTLSSFPNGEEQINCVVGTATPPVNANTRRQLEHCAVARRWFVQPNHEVVDGGRTAVAGGLLFYTEDRRQSRASATFECGHSRLEQIILHTVESDIKESASKRKWSGNISKTIWSVANHA